jgi:hypothetical protein
MRNDIEVLVIDAVDRTNVVASFSMRVWVCASALFLCGYSTLAQSRLTFGRGVHQGEYRGRRAACDRESAGSIHRDELSP